MGKLGAEAGKSLADVVALNIGQLGENMALGDVNYLTTSQGQTSSHTVCPLWLQKKCVLKSELIRYLSSIVPRVHEDLVLFLSFKMYSEVF